ncbi:MAG: hypothetical protein ABSA30_02885, partial [Candidatus Aminicenantales bacterium]
MIAAAGRKGQGPGDFQNPILIACFNKFVFIVDLNSSGIRIYDTDLKFVRSFTYPLPIYSFVALSENDLLVVTMGKSVFPPLARIDLRKSGVAEAGLSDFKPDAWWKFSGKITTDQNGNIFYISSFEDIIAKFDPRGNLQWKKSLRSGEKSGEKTISTKLGPMTAPTEILYKDIAVDRKGRLFVMGGHKAVHRSRDIYVLNENGDLIETLTLPEPTHILHFDKNGDLFVSANEGATIKKYRLEDKK